MVENGNPAHGESNKHRHHRDISSASAHVKSSHAEAVTALAAANAVEVQADGEHTDGVTESVESTSEHSEAKEPLERLESGGPTKQKDQAANGNDVRLVGGLLARSKVVVTRVRSLFGGMNSSGSLGYLSEPVTTAVPKVSVSSVQFLASTSVY
jgi:hypothetical protein